MCVEPRHRRTRKSWQAILAASVIAFITVPLVACGGARKPSDESRKYEQQAESYRERGDYVRALSLRANIVEGAVKQFGEFSEPCAVAMQELGLAFLDLGDLTNAIGTLRRVLQIREQLKGPKDASLASTLDALGRAYIERGNIMAASQSLQRSLAIQATALGEDHPSQAVTALLLGRVALATGQPELAQLLIGIAQRYFTQIEGPTGPHAAAVIGGFAASATDLQDDARAAQLWDQAIAMAEKVRGSNSEEVAEYLTARAHLHILREEYKPARPLLVRAERILSRSANPKSARMARFLEVGAKELFLGRGDLVHAQDLLARSLAMTEQRTATNSPYTASVLETLMEVYWAQDDLPQAVSMLEHLEAVSEDTIRGAENAFSRGTDQVRLRPLLVLEWEKDFAVSLSLLTNSDRAKRLSLTTLLHRKGRMQELLANEVRVARARTKPETANHLDAYLNASRQFSHAAFGALIDGRQPDSDQVAIRFRDEREQALWKILGVTEADSEAANEAMMNAAEPATVENVTAAMPADVALVEFTRFIPYDWRKEMSHEPRYAAMVLWKDGRIEQADLGEAKPIDDLVARLRRATSNPQEDPKPFARMLDDRVMRPVRALLGATRRLIIAGDGALSLVPFGALIDEHGEYLVKNWYLLSLTTGRELLALARKRTSAGGASLVIADPDFGPRSDASAGARGVDIKVLRRARFPQLPGTAQEGKAVAAMLGAELVSGARATREFLSSQRAPGVLHIATHGFFLQDSEATTGGSRGLVLSSTTPTNIPIDALYRSGLVFAGANHNTPDLNAIFTAQEALALDLEGTDLVVLSACETGIGEVSTGQGVRGLQQAFMSAGARSLVMSLWKVDDAATRDLMKWFYAALSEGKGPAVALRSAQLQLLSQQGQSHPFYWASFIQYGDPSPLRPGAFASVRR